MSDSLVGPAALRNLQDIDLNDFEAALLMRFQMKNASL